MKYKIVSVSGNNDYSKEIDPESFQQIKNQFEIGLRCQSIEEKFSILVENYSELEKEILSICADNIIHIDQDWSSLQNNINLINRRILNVLTSAKLYIDQTKHDINVISGKDAKQNLEKLFSREYDDHLGYRVMEAMRNYVQHRSLPISKLIHVRSLVNKADQEYHRYSLKMFININKIERDSKFKQTILDELKEYDNEIEITKFLRTYISSIGKVHKNMNQIIWPYLSKCENYISKFILEYKEDSKDDFYPLLIAEDSSGKEISNLVVFDDFIKRRKFLKDKNIDISYCYKRFVSGEI